MDKYTVQLMPRALRDLDGIYGYIAKELSEPTVAERQINRLEQGILSLDTLPARCSIRRVGAYANKGYRQLHIDHYTVIFRINEAEKQVIVVTVRYSHSQF